MPVVAMVLNLGLSCLGTTPALAQLCQPSQFSCLAANDFDARGQSIVQCNTTGDGGLLVETCPYDPFGFPPVEEFCFEGINFCGSGSLACSALATRGCFKDFSVLQCNFFGNGVDLVVCPAGTTCVGTGQCADIGLTFLEQNPDPNVFVGDIAVTELPNETTAITAFADGAFATNDLQLRVLDPNAVSYLVSSGIVGMGRGIRVSAARNLATDSVLAAWYKTTGTAPNEVHNIYKRWLNPDGSESEAEALVAEGRFPAAVALGPRTGVIVWTTGAFPSFNLTGRFLDPAGSFDFPVGPAGDSAGFAEAAPHGDGFIVTWRFDNVAVHAQCFDSSGTPVLSSPLIVASGGGQQTAPIVAGAPGQDAVIVWYDVQTAFRAQQIDTDCALVGNVIEVATELPTSARKAVAMWPNGRFVVAYEEMAADQFGILRRSLFTTEYAADGTFEETALVGTFGTLARDGLAVATWGTDSSIAVWVADRNIGSLATRPCARDIAIANQTVSEERARKAKQTATLGTDLIANSANFSVNAPTVSFVGSVTIGGSFEAGNTPDCPGAT
jgi:hypothetical protein